MSDRTSNSVILPSDPDAAYEVDRLRAALYIYGGHIPPCAGRPCECGFLAEWQHAKLPANALEALRLAALKEIRP